MIGAEQIKEGAVLLDVGVSRVEDLQKGNKVLTGDIDPAAAERASWMSPNPGGVGPDPWRYWPLALPATDDSRRHV